MLSSFPRTIHRTKSAENVKAVRQVSEDDFEKRPKTVSELLLQIEGEGIRSKSRPKIEVRNYARENVLRLREIQRACRQTKETRNMPMKPEYQPNRGRDIHSSISTYQSKPACRTSSVNYNRTLHTKEIKVPSAHQKNQNLQGTSTATPKMTTPTKEAAEISNESENEVKDEHLNHTKINSISIPKLNIGSNQHERPGTLLVNKRRVDSKAFNEAKEKPRLCRSSSLSSIFANKTKCNLQLPEKYQLGVVPKYLHVRQKQWRDEEEKRKRDAPDPSIPPGLELLPDAERLQTLSQLDQNYNELVKQMLLLPVRMDTLRVRQQKENIEKEMVKVEEAIKIFSQPKVFIKKDE